MTLEESILFYEEQAKKCNNKVNQIILGAERCEQDKQEYTQLAEWLRELHERRSADAVRVQSSSKIDTFCSNCRNEAPEGKINSDCLMCMHLYGVHTQEANKEAAYESINFPKRDLFEPKKG